MAYAVMGGLVVATLLTLVFYVAWFKIEPKPATRWWARPRWRREQGKRQLNRQLRAVKKRSIRRTILRATAEICVSCFFLAIPQ